MIEPIMVKLSVEILDTLTIEDIIYAEYAEPGAMGNAGGVMIYSITEDSFNCYETNIFTDKAMYNQVIDLLKRNQITSRYNTETNENGIFNFYGGGMGNNVLINKNVSLIIANGYFVFIKNGKEYTIYSSVQGVFMRVCSALQKTRNLEYCKIIRILRAYIGEYFDEAEKQRKLLYEKLDKKIIAKRVYTQEEINEILKECCPDQDYASLRKDLVVGGYLYRTFNDKEFWKRVE
jgi:hypothetical protein